MTATADAKATVDELRGWFAGELVQPGDPMYDERRRVWNGSIDGSSALIARCRGVADAMAAIRFARDTSLPVAVRGGGHSYPGHSVCDAGIVIDLGLMKSGRVSGSSPSSRFAFTPSDRRSWPGRSTGRWLRRRLCCASIATGSPRRRTS
jgi:hypothetical protein